MTATDISPIELEIIHNALTAAAAEMDVTVWRTSRSTIVRELLDYSTAIFDRDGWNVAQAARIPSHLNSMSYFLTEILAKHIPPDQWQPDDVVISNDPYCGGQHLPDIVAFKAGVPRGPAHRLRRHAVPSPGCRRLLARQLRLERHRDLPGRPAHPAVEAVRGGQAGRAHPRASCCRTCGSPSCCGAICSRRSPRSTSARPSIERLAAKLGEARFERALKQLLDSSEAGMRAVISRIPDGTYEFEDKHRRRRHHRRSRSRIRAKVIVAGDEMTVDLTGCSPQSLGPSNATLASTCSTVFYALMATADVPVASNAGCYRPVKVIAPPGTCVNAASPAPVVHRIAIGHRLATVLFARAAQGACPQRMPAAYYAVSYVVTFQTIDPKLGRKVLVEIEIGGCGGLPYSDGASAHSFGMHNNANIPMEMIESDMPLTFLGYGLMPGLRRALGATAAASGCGASGASIARPRSSPPTSTASSFPRSVSTAACRPALSALTLIRDGKTQALPSKVTNLMVRKGDIVRLETSGGGGFGAPTVRPRELDRARRPATAMSAPRRLPPSTATRPRGRDTGSSVPAAASRSAADASTTRSDRGRACEGSCRRRIASVLRPPVRPSWGMKIISGGQSGVDRAALDVAIERGMDWGGWCPRGGWAEDFLEPPGLLTKYPHLKETPDSHPLQRTEWNVRDSDATLIITDGAGLSVSIGNEARPSMGSPTRQARTRRRCKRCWGSCARRGVARCAAQEIRAAHDARHRRSARERGAGHLQERSAVHRRAARACEATPLSRSGSHCLKLATDHRPARRGPGPLSFRGRGSDGPGAEEFAVALDQRLALVAGEWGAGLVTLLAPHARDGHRPEAAEACNETRMVRKVPLERRPDSCYCIRVSYACDRDASLRPWRSRTCSPTPLRGGCKRRAALGGPRLSLWWRVGEDRDNGGDPVEHAPYAYCSPGCR